MRVIGYTRVSTEEQGRSGLGLDAQAAAIRERFATADVRSEVKSGKRADNRPVLQHLLSELRRGDTLVVSKLDRLARSTADFYRIADQAQHCGWSLVVLDVGIDTGTIMGKAMIGMLAVFAEFERDMTSLRRREAEFARRPELGSRFEQIRELAASGLSQRQIQRELGLSSKETVARALRAVTA